MNIDRIAPTRRPTSSVVQRQRWAQLLFLHWRIDPRALRELVPAELAIDTHEGDAFVGVVPFTMTGVRPVWAPPVPGISNFHETNVRTYVVDRRGNPGVWFFSLDAASRVAVTLARTFWHLPYHFAQMSLSTGRSGETVYETNRLWPKPLPAHFSARYAPSGEAFHAVAGTTEHFLAERYILFAQQSDGRLVRGRVHHTPYPLQAVNLLDWRESLLAASGLVRPSGEPLAHYAAEVSVEIFGLEDAAD
jgi:hypothetical protein